MGTLVYSYTITNGTVNDADEVTANYTDIANVLNGNVDSNNINQGDIYGWTNVNTFSPISLKLLANTGTGKALVRFQSSNNNPTVTLHDPVDSTGYLQVTSNNNIVVHNFRMKLSAGILSFCGNDGNDFSSTNIGVIKLRSTTTGKWDTVEFTSAVTFDDATAADSDFTGSGTTSLGTTAAVAWGNSLPVMFYVATDGTTPYIFFSRNPCATATPLTTYIGYKDVAPGTSNQTNFMAMTGTNVTVTHASRACTPIGSARLTKNSSDNWTWTTLDNGDGVLNFYNFGARLLQMPIGQNGATASKYFNNNGGTAPTYTAENNYFYYITLNGRVYCDFFFSNAAGGTVGAGAVELTLTAPLAAIWGAATNIRSHGSGIVSNSGSLAALVVTRIAGTTTSIRFEYQSTLVTATTAVTNVLQNNATRTVTGTINYPAF